MKFRKRPLEFDAMQVTSFNAVSVLRWAWSLGFSEKDLFPLGKAGNLLVETSHGGQIAVPGDWIIVGACGRLYPCKDDLFRKIAEEVVSGN